MISIIAAVAKNRAIVVARVRFLAAMSIRHWRKP